MKRIKSTIVKLALVFLGFNAYGQAPAIPNGGGIDPNDVPFSQYIEENEAHFNNLKSQGIDVTNLNTYKTYERTLEMYRYYNGFPNITIQQVTDSYNSWVKANGATWNCVINNQYPFLTFNEIGPNQHTIEDQDNLEGTGQIHYLEFDYSVANESKMYACSGYGGLFQTINGGQDWTNAGTDFGLPASGVSSIALSPSDPTNTWYVTTGNAEFYGGPDKPAFGVWRTNNGGLSYELIIDSGLGGDSEELLSSIKIRKTIALVKIGGGTRLVVAAENGLFLCNNPDASNPFWLKIANGSYYDIEVTPNNQDIIYALGDRDTPLISYDLENNQLTTLSDLNINFTYSNGDIRRASIEFCHDVADKFVLMLTENQGKVNGNNHTKMYYYDISTNELIFKGDLIDSDGPGQQAGIGRERGMAWAVSPHLVNGEILVVHGCVKPIRLTSIIYNNTEVLSSEWTDIMHSISTNNVHDDMHYMKFNSNSTTLFVGTDGGLYKTEIQPLNTNYTGYNWTNLNKGLSVGTAYTVSTSQNGDREIFASFQDMGNILMEQDINGEWVPYSENFGDGWNEFINATDSKKMMGVANSSYDYTLDGWTTSSSYPTLFSSSGKKYFLGNAENRDILYGCTTSGLKKSVFGNSWVLNSNFPDIPVGNDYVNPQWIYNLAVSENPKHSDYIYVEWRGGTISPDGSVFPETFPRIYKSSVGGGTNLTDWENVYDYPSKGWGKIAMNFENPDIIYVSNNAELWKINTVTGLEEFYGQGLPDISTDRAFINDICYVNGSDEAMYVSTRHGLYYRDNEHYPDGFIRICSMPNARITDVEIDYCRKKIVVATYGRGIWEADIDLPQTNPYVVDAGTTITISGDYYSGTDLIVEENATLIVTGTLYMPQDEKITVKKSGNLKVDGGTITNACGGLWDGIEVWGDNSDLTQSYSVQGHARFIDATIENANVAVRNYGNLPNGKVDWGSMGGIIQSTNSTFQNNRRDVAFHPYQRMYSNGNPANDRSFFTTTNFIWDDEFRHTPLNHITMNKSFGIRFTGCVFADDRTAPTSDWVTSQNVTSCGIRSIDSKFYVQAKCNSLNIASCYGDLSTGNWTSTKFRNLDFGIYASNSHTERGIIVDRCEFTDNLYGVELVYSNSPVVTRSNFTYTANTNFSNNFKYGIHVIRTNEVRFEENKFYNNLSTRTVGIVCSDLGESENELYKNTFENLSYAVITQGKNRNGDGDKGLQFFCNENTNNSRDYLVKNYLWGANPSSVNGVREQNGFLELSSANTFTQNGNPKEDYNNELPNGTNNVVAYYFLPANQILEKPIDVAGPVFYGESDIANTCPSNFNNYGIIKLPLLTKSQLASDFYTAENELILKKQNFSTLLDGGNTQLLLDQIENLAPNNKQQLRQTLLSYSPYLSVEVIKAVIDNPANLYPPLWCYELILENIDIASSPDFIEFLYTKEGNMPNWMIENIEWHSQNNSFSDKLVLESEISKLYYDKSFTSNMLIRSYKSDTTDNDLDSMKVWIERKNDVLTETRVIDIHIQKGDFQTATTELNTLVTNINNHPVHLQQEILDFVDLKLKVIEILSSDIGQLAAMSQGDHKFFIQMANSGTGVAQYQAQEVLCFYFDECTERPVYGVEETKSMQNNSSPEEVPLKYHETEFKIYPNPADDWLAVELPVDTKGARIVVYDNQGKLVFEQNVYKPIFIFETINLPNGNYVIQINSLETNKLIGTEKIVITH